ncbi:uncharacterized protein LTR77_009522 [Saxophila tyrrhenica]|uniref:Uncharacterized protein n=1 Tax=Saxophila tyrrhenica TaxID=1690608 RepID=A0AAV9NYV1_9PEZI|nr:hypothetical protein LTR77_009522 [Saxophila tyrrhenica]
MPINIMRNPFRKQDENARPTTGGAERPVNGAATKPVDIKEKEGQPTEYKLSEINDSGVFVPPSPPERKSFWTTSSSRSTTTLSSAHRSVFNENEPFNISRESFDSYRRSFDISARSPVIQPTEQRPRASLDSRTFQQPAPRSSSSFHRPLQVPRTQKEEEGDLEEVALDEPKPAPQKKRGMLSRIMDSDSHSERPSSHDGTSKSSAWHHFGGRKRGQSGQGAELGSIPKREETPKPESQLKKENTPKPADAQEASEDVAKPATTQPTSTEAPSQPKPQTPQATAGAQKENSQAPVVTVNGVS